MANMGKATAGRGFSANRCELAANSRFSQNVVTCQANNCLTFPLVEERYLDDLGTNQAKAAAHAATNSKE
jgi:hypothetical protein